MSSKITKKVGKSKFVCVTKIFLRMSDLRATGSLFIQKNDTTGFQKIVKLTTKELMTRNYRIEIRDLFLLS